MNILIRGFAYNIRTIRTTVAMVATSSVNMTMAMTTIMSTTITFKQY